MIVMFKYYSYENINWGNPKKKGNGSSAQKSNNVKENTRCSLLDSLLTLKNKMTFVSLT